MPDNKAPDFMDKFLFCINSRWIAFKGSKAVEKYAQKNILKLGTLPFLLSFITFPTMFIKETF